MKYFAHSENTHNEKHALAKHLHQTAKFAESFACREDYKPIFNVTGLLQQQGVSVVQSAFREGSRYAYMDPSELGGITFEFVERTPG